MSASEFRIPYQQVSPSQPAENVNQFKTCRCGEGDPNSTSETGDSPPASCPNCQVLKSGHLLLSSKGIGWTSWKKRWFVLTRASLVFFRSDPNVPPPRGAEPIVTLGGIDLNNSGSVVIKEERKLLTVFFPDGHGERTFTLKAETTGDLNEWRNALESAIAQAPSIANTMGQNPIFSTDVEAESAESPAEHSEDRSVIGRPAKFALVDADGSPSFLEKALKFIEDHGKNEFSPEEDAHVIGDCIKYVLREMPSSPVPASCCTALVKAYRSDKARRLDEINRVINEVFPEPNRQLLQRTLKMMQVVESHKAVNRMSQSALAACMAPLLLRPLLLGECDIDNEFSMGGDSSFQLLQAAAAANHAQAIVIIMMEEFDQIFDDSEEGSCSSDAYTESEDDVDKEYSTDNDTHDDDGSYDSGEDDIEEDLDYSDDSEHDSKINANIKDGKVKNNISETAEVAQAEDTSPMDINSQSNQKQESCGPNGSKDRILRSTSRSSSSREKTMEKSCSSAHKGKRTLWGRTSARKDLSTEEIECCSDDEALVEKLESNKIDLQSKIAKEAKENAILWSSLEKRKEELHERRLALEKEVENLRDQLKRVMNLRRGQVSSPSTIDSKVRGQQLCCESCNQRLLNTDRLSGPESSSVEASPTVGSDPAFDMGDIEQSRKQAAQHSPSSRDKPSHEAVGGITQRAPQRGHSIAREGQDGSSSLSSSNSKWNLAQKQYSNSPLIRGLHVSSRLEDFGGSISPAASSALAKLTNRLNFLKERRALLASEMQSLDLGRPPTVKSPTPKGHESKNS
ncbi:rho GTPase-activating protein REN1 isoform X8 [Zea mays]|uniref:Rho GTPase activation protein (RhoGAP) with PH domain n=1 Tax=Zea mays TaxID=4577 RepID=A0A1D6LJB5_MAIZE|nr:rho GTPase-activating protein REN1 isoform X8 [Zea mays]XP_035815824.1 rho GTPase-activating protein REN1 isoform X8 [Zea mays]AQK79863.1 Rho GTPase activation protein (RhoGAP) with PH domain [Zea mays]|eukprot:XP_020394835.1 rho GTPase-activating protein REN1 isoform X7 [Zea mays]